MKPSVPLSFMIGIKTRLGLARRPWPSNLSKLATPIDFVDYRELAFVYSAILEFVRRPRTVLDIASPKLLPITLAYAWPDVDVLFIDIRPEEGNWIKSKAKRLNLGNLKSQVLDARSLPFNDCSFDLVTSVCVFEHITPEKGGEIPAVKEVARILKPGGIMVLTVPFSRSYFAEYRNHSVYERSQSSPNERVFFQRFYDTELLERIFTQESGLMLEYLGFIYERFFYSDPHRRLIHYINFTSKQRIWFGPMYPLLSRIFLSSPQELKPKGKPYIACLVLKKRGQ